MRKISFIKYAATAATLALASLVGTLFSGCSDHWPASQPIPPTQPTLEQRIILNEGEDVRLGDTFFIQREVATLQYIAHDPQNRTLRFVKPGARPEEIRDLTYDADNNTAIFASYGYVHAIKVNPDGSLQVDLDADNIISKNSTFFKDRLVVDMHTKIAVDDFFIIKTKDGLVPYKFDKVSYYGTEAEIDFENYNRNDVYSYNIQGDNGQYKREIIFNGTSILVALDSTTNEVTLSSFDGQNLECLLDRTIVANEGRSIKPGEHFLIDTMDSPSPKGEVWKYVGKNPADSILNFRKFGPAGFETQEITLSNGEATLLASGFSYKIKMNSDQTVNIDLDKSGFIRKNEVPLLDRFVFNEKRPVAGGDVFVLENTAQTEQFHAAYRLQNIDTVNKVVYFTNLNLPQSVECSYSTTDGNSGTLVSSGISHNFTVTEADNTIQIDMNGDGKIE